MTELETKLLTYNKLYRIGKPVVSDKEYDELFDSLPADSVLRKSGVIEEVPSDRKWPLPIPMFSMDKVKTVTELKDWLRSLSVPSDTLLIVTPKYDGISLCANENTGNAWTRGNGYIGQESRRHFANMLSGSPCTSFEYTFGEAIMPLPMFNKYKGEYANTRNLVGGLFNSSKIDSALRDVAYVRYGCSDINKDKSDILEELNKVNPFFVPSYIVGLSDVLSDDNDYLEDTFNELYKEYSEIFLIDGLIIEIDSADYRKNSEEKRIIIQPMPEQLNWKGGRKEIQLM